MNSTVRVVDSGIVTERTIMGMRATWTLACRSCGLVLHPQVAMRHERLYHDEGSRADCFRIDCDGELVSSYALVENVLTKD